MDYLKFTVKLRNYIISIYNATIYLRPCPYDRHWSPLLKYFQMQNHQVYTLNIKIMRVLTGELLKNKNLDPPLPKFFLVYSPGCNDLSLMNRLFTNNSK